MTDKEIRQVEKAVANIVQQMTLNDELCNVKVTVSGSHTYVTLSLAFPHESWYNCFQIRCRINRDIDDLTSRELATALYNIQTHIRQLREKDNEDRIEEEYESESTRAGGNDI